MNWAKLLMNHGFYAKLIEVAKGSNYLSRVCTNPVIIVCYSRLLWQNGSQCLSAKVRSVELIRLTCITWTYHGHMGFVHSYFVSIYIDESYTNKDIHVTLNLHSPQTKWYVVIFVVASFGLNSIFSLYTCTYKHLTQGQVNCHFHQCFVGLLESSIQSPYWKP